MLDLVESLNVRNRLLSEENLVLRSQLDTTLRNHDLEHRRIEEECSLLRTRLEDGLRDFGVERAKLESCCLHLTEKVEELEAILENKDRSLRNYRVWPLRIILP